MDSLKISFASRGMKWQQPLGEPVVATVHKGILTIGSGDSSASFDLGEKAGRWLEKVVHPPSRVKKLGIKSGQSVFLIGSFDQDFLDELSSARAAVVEARKGSDLVLAVVETKRKLDGLRKHIEKLEIGKSLWIVWPKGIAAITERQVIELGREYGMGPGKSCAFNECLTAMRFTRK